jgi:hypothetical protein
MELTVPGYYKLRQYLRRSQALRPLLAQARHLVLAGPLRPAIIAYHRAVARATPIKTNTLPYVEPFSIEDAVQSLNESGFAAGVRVTSDCVDKLLKCYETNLVQSYDSPHLDHEFITELAHNERLVTVARRYLGAEPIFLESRLHCYNPDGSNSPRYFHYDVADAMSVTFFVFLSDVEDEQAVTHQVVGGTHKAKTFQELWTHRLEDSRAYARYPDGVHTIMGKRGTAWFEDPVTFHKHGYVGKVRKTFSLQYSLHRQR